ncbi:hypothetical protein ACIQGT_41015 [Streptomyces sp. NPDC093108]|jgi:hypothetical protein
MSDIAEQQAADALAQQRIEEARQAAEGAELARQQAELIRQQRG